MDTNSYDLKVDWNDGAGSHQAHWAPPIPAAKPRGLRRVPQLGRLQLRHQRHAAPDFSGYNYGSAPATSERPRQPVHRSRRLPSTAAGAPTTAPRNTGWGGNIVTKPTWDEEVYGGRLRPEFDSPSGALRLTPRARDRAVDVGRRTQPPSPATPMPPPRNSRHELHSNYLQQFRQRRRPVNPSIDGWALAN